MSKELIKEALGLSTKRHEYDMRPRFQLDTYAKILEISRDTGIPQNIVLRAMTKLFLEEMEQKSRDQVLASIKNVAA